MCASSFPAVRGLRYSLEAKILMEYEDQAAEIQRICKQFNVEKMTIDTTGMGQGRLPACAQVLSPPCAACATASKPRS
ncbi:hypothetical protein, partial [Escherichia coli]|uniref:hypothetical protein n=1 Tax=Escherichia coli TaxID=562 RepID=UPI000BC491E0